MFTPAAGAATTITISSTVAAGNVNSIDAFNAALSAAGIGLNGHPWPPTDRHLHLDQRLCQRNPHAGDDRGCEQRRADRHGHLRTCHAGWWTAGNPVPDAASQTVRANLVAQYNNILQQITTTSQDASFNGINLLNGDDLKLTFNETGKSTLNIKGVTFNAAGLGLASLTAGTDFLDNSSANATIANIASASNLLRTEASSLGSNLSVVQIRQDFSKNLINVLQTGSSNLTLADTNEEAANSQALSTRQSIAVSALALANQTQQSVLQLLR